MKLVFRGTRGGVEARSPMHWMHSVLEISHNHTRLRIDYGADWRRQKIGAPVDAIFVTHAHSDHVEGMRDGVECPVYATETSWNAMNDYPIDDQIRIVPRVPVRLGDVIVEAFSLHHSYRAPAVGYRISAGRARIFYAPDVAGIIDHQETLLETNLYIGDGSSLSRSLLIDGDAGPTGHARIETQLSWCREGKVPQAVFTHCGTEIIEADHRKTTNHIANLAQSLGIVAHIAYDGMHLAVFQNQQIIFPRSDGLR